MLLVFKYLKSPSIIDREEVVCASIEDSRKIVGIRSKHAEKFLMKMIMIREIVYKRLRDKSKMIEYE